MSVASARPSVLIVGGEDVHQRIDLMDQLRGRYAMVAAGAAPELRERFDSARLGFHYYPLSRGANPYRDLYAAACLLRLFRRERPDVVHTFATKPGVWGRIAARLAGVPIVLGTLPGLGSLFTGDDLRTRALRALYLPLQRTACRVSDLTIFQVEEDRREFVGAGLVARERSAVVSGSGISTERFDAARVPPETRARLRAELGLRPDEIVVTMVSRLIRSKGVAEFAAAAERLADRSPAVRFVLVGPDDAASLDRLSPEELAGVRRSVLWLGSRTDVREILAASDVAVLPSYYREGIPRSLMEAASMGLPLVATPLPGCRAVVQERVNGLLVPTRDVDALAAAVGELAGSATMRREYGAASRRLAVERFDISVIAHETGVWYDRLLQSKATSMTEPSASSPALRASPSDR